MKFTPEHGRVGIAAELEENAGLCITIADTGIGMSADEIEWALELFRQVDNSFTKRFEGTGLGLPLARQFTKLHGGTLAIESAPGEGTKVFVRLPAERVVLDPVERPRGSNLLGMACANAARQRIASRSRDRKRASEALLCMHPAIVGISCQFLPATCVRIFFYWKIFSENVLAAG